MEITMKGISKAFGSNEVLKGVDLTLKSGEIHALMGENGAGKSTLMNILTGIHKADSGTICVDGREISFKNALEAEKCGIAFIHQELNIWPNLSILENLFLMQNVTNSFGMLDFKKMRRLAEEKCSQMGITLPFDAEAGALSGGNQQKVVIAKWIGMNPSIIIMDEPTRGIDVGAKRDIYDLMNELTSQGVAIIMVSSELPEVIGMSDRILVIHEGKIAGELDHEEATQEKIITLATGGQ